MKRKLSVAFLACVLALTLAFGLTACKKGGEGGTSGETPSGDDFGNYANPVKPELWSVTNTLYLSWHKQNAPAEDIDFEHNPEETTSGFATWTVGGLLSTGPIQSLGIFYLKRIADVGELEN